MPEAVTPRFGDSETANTRLSSTDQVTNAGGLLLQQRGSENRLPCVHLLTSDAHDPDGMGFAGVESSGHDSWGVLIQAKNDTPGEDHRDLQRCWRPPRRLVFDRGRSDAGTSFAELYRPTSLSIYRTSRIVAVGVISPLDQNSTVVKFSN
jgi:hypothetical protein